ncbi:hypothetical protein PCE1_000397 [Barthelona sp. PCE]
MSTDNSPVTEDPNKRLVESLVGMTVESTSTSEAISELADAFLASKNIVFCTGAGLSVASGISLYRSDSEPNAIWNNYVETTGRLETMRKMGVTKWFNEFLMDSHYNDSFLNAIPNAGHDAITELTRIFPNTSVITQNVDNLHKKSGMEYSQLYEVHGNLTGWRCLNRNCKHHKKEVLRLNLDDYIIPGSSDPLRYDPKCPLCDSHATPNVLWFDMSYGDIYMAGGHTFDDIVRLISAADVVCFVGTSNSVGITGHIEHIVYDQNKLAFDFNISSETTLVRSKLIQGPAAETLPALVNLLKERAPDRF